MNVIDSILRLPLHGMLKFHRSDCGQVEVLSLKEKNKKPVMVYRLAKGKKVSCTNFKKETTWIWMGPKK